jgi:hypothetical protein
VSQLQAQSKAKALHPVTLVQLDVVPGDKKAMVFRRTSGDDRDVIALGPKADQADLGMALHVLDAMYEKFGDQPPRAMAASVTSLPAAKSAGPRGKLHAAFVQKLRQSRVRNVGGFGAVKAFEIRVKMKHAK